MGFLKRLRGDDGRSKSSEPAGHVHDPNLAVNAPGWVAIDAAADALYHATPPFHYGTKIRWRAGGPDPLDGLSVYVNDGPPSHWHFVTYGLSELYAKEAPDPDVSGWGFELTLRVARTDGEMEPPQWAWGHMQNLARYVFESGIVFGTNHTMNLNGPIALQTETDIRAITFVEDPQLRSIQTPNGRVVFLQIVGVSLDEYRAMVEWSVSEMLKLLGARDPFFVTDLARKSLLSDPATAELVQKRESEEGSAMAGLRASEASWAAIDDAVKITIGAMVIDRFQIHLTRRCALGHDAVVWCPGASIRIIPAATFGWHVVPSEPTVLHLEVPPEGARELAACLKPLMGTYAAPSLPGLLVDVTETVVRDQQGNEVERIGGATVQ